MKKVILNILFFGVTILGLTGCNKSDEKDNLKDGIHTFQGTIIKCEQKAMIVKPDETEEEYKSSDKFRVEYVDGFDTCNIDTKVKVTYEGEINEIYPAQIGTKNIEIVEANTKNISMTIKENSLTDSGIILIMKNNSEQKYYYGPEYYLEKYENGTLKFR